VCRSMFSSVYMSHCLFDRGGFRSDVGSGFLYMLFPRGILCMLDGFDAPYSEMKYLCCRYVFECSAESTLAASIQIKKGSMIYMCLFQELMSYITQYFSRSRRPVISYSYLIFQYLQISCNQWKLEILDSRFWFQLYHLLFLDLDDFVVSRFMVFT
jgi:hypothetical protein